MEQAPIRGSTRIKYIIEPLFIFTIAIDNYGSVFRLNVITLLEVA